MSIYHGGVIKAAGVVHVGTPTTQVRNYVEAGMFLVLCGCLVALAWLVSTAPEGE